MEEPSKEERIRKLAEQHFGWEDHNILGAGLPFDISKPNIHDNKKEFLQELDTVEQVIAHIDGIFDLLITRFEEPGRKDMGSRLRIAINESARRAVGNRPVDSAVTLVQRNASETGLQYTSLLILLDLRDAYKTRLKALSEQKTQFWDVRSRPPNYFARTIALRFAQFYARQTGQRPTFGISKEGPYPSTDYGRILERIFDILEIRAQVRSPAEWAIGQIVEDDFKPPEVSSVGGLLGSLMNFAPPSNFEDPIQAIARQLKKGEE